MSRGSSLAKNTIIIAIGSFFPRIAGFITLPILTGYLTKTEYGTLDLITILTSLLLPSVTLQIQAAAFRFIIDSREDNTRQKKIITNIFVMIIPVSVAALVIFYFILPNTAFNIKFCICLYLFFNMVATALRQVARGFGKNREYTISAIISAFSKMILVVLFVWGAKKGLFGAVIGLVLSTIISTVYLFKKLNIYSYISRENIDKQILVEMLSYSWPLVPNEMSQWVMRVSDRVVVTWFIGIAANAVYAVANKIPSIIMLAQSAFTLAWQENASISSKDKDASEYYSHMFEIMYKLYAGFFGIVIALMPVLFKVLIRGDYGEAYVQMPILCIAIFFAGISTFFGGIYVAYKASKSVGVTTLVAASINLAVDIGTIKWLGLYAASGSTLVSYIFLCIYRMRDVQKLVKVSYSIRKFLGVIVLLVLEGALCYLRIPVCNIINIVLGSVSFVLLNKSFLQAVLSKVQHILRNRG